MATIVFDETFPEAKAEVTVETIDGVIHSADHDAGVPDSDLVRQQGKLENKFVALVEPILGGDETQQLLKQLISLDEVASLDEIMAMTRRNK